MYFLVRNPCVPCDLDMATFIINTSAAAEGCNPNADPRGFHKVISYASLDDIVVIATSDPCTAQVKFSALQKLISPGRAKAAQH